MPEGVESRKRRILLRYPRLVVRAYTHYIEHQGARMAAAMAYYGLFAIVPLVIIVTYVLSLVVGPDVARVTLNEQLSLFLPETVANAIAGVRKGLLSIQSSSLTPLISAALLVYAATTALAEMRNALNVLWCAPPGRRHPILLVVKERALSLLGVLAIAVLMLFSIVLSTVLTVVDEHLETAWESMDASMGGLLGESSFILDAVGAFGLEASRQALDLAQLATNVYGLSATLVLILLVYVVLPDVRLPVGATFAGAVLTTLMFWIGQWLLALYFANSARLSAFGAATTVVVVLLWAYYSAQMLYFGAAFAYAYAKKDITAADGTDLDESAERALPLA